MEQLPNTKSCDFYLNAFFYERTSSLFAEISSRIQHIRILYCRCEKECADLTALLWRNDARTRHT